MDMPLEVELLVAAWDNVKKNVLDAEGLGIDPETGEIMGGEDERLGDITAQLDDAVCELIRYYVRGRDEVGVMANDGADDDLDTPDANNPEWLVDA
jgi:hypothetical protein